MEEVLDLEHGAQTPPLRLRLCHLLLFHCLPLASQQLQPRDNSRSSEKEKNTEFCHNRKPNKLTLEHKSAGDLHCNVVIWSIMIVFVFFTATKIAQNSDGGKKKNKTKKRRRNSSCHPTIQSRPWSFLTSLPLGLISKLRGLEYFLLDR